MLIPEDAYGLDVDEAPDVVCARLGAVLAEGSAGAGSSPRLAGRFEGDRGILWFRGPFAGNAFRRRLRLRVRARGAEGSRLEGSFAVHPRIRLLFGALVVGALAFFVAGAWVALSQRTLLPFPFLAMPFVLWGLRTMGLAASRAEEAKLRALLERAIDAERRDAAADDAKLPREARA